MLCAGRIACRHHLQPQPLRPAPRHAACRFEFCEEEARYAFRLVDYGARELQVAKPRSSCVRI